MSDPVVTYCQICEQSCGLVVTAADGRIATIQPDRAQRHWRDFCIKGGKAGLVRDHPMRLKSPMRRVGDRWVAATYAEAIDEIADRLTQLRTRYGPGVLGSYTGNPHGYSVSNSSFHSAFMDAFGSINRYWVGSIDQNALHYVAQEMFGSGWTSLLPDVDHCDCLMLVGANPAISAMNWMGSVPEGWRRILARPAGSDLIIVDPRETESVQHATLHLAALPETDWALLLAMIAHIAENGMVATRAFEQASRVTEILTLAKSVDTARLAAYCDIPLDRIIDAAERFGRARTAACIARTGPALGRYGTLTEWLSHVLNLITGRIDVEGGRYLNLAPVNPIELSMQMFPPQTTPSRVRGSLPISGHYPLAELPDEIATPGPGQLRALIVNAGNPVISGPDGQRLAAAFKDLELFVGIDLLARESHRDAHWLIPGIHFLERTEFSPMFPALSTDIHVQAGRAVLPPPEGVMPEWQFYKALAEKMGLVLFGGMVSEPTALIDMMLASGTSGLTYDSVMAAPHGITMPHQGFGHLKDWTLTPDRKINAAPDVLLDRLRTALDTVDAKSDGSYRLVSRRRMAAMNSWLVDTIGDTMRDQRGDALEMNAEDMETDGLSDGDLVIVSGPVGEVRARVIGSRAIRRGVVVMEHGWGGKTFDPASDTAKKTGVNRNELVSGGDLDPLSMVPRLNGTPVRINAAAL